MPTEFNLKLIIPPTKNSGNALVENRWGRFAVRIVNEQICQVYGQLPERKNRETEKWHTAQTSAFFHGLDFVWVGTKRVYYQPVDFNTEQLVRSAHNGQLSHLRHFYR